MIQDIAPRVMDNAYRDLQPMAEDFVFSFKNDKLLCGAEG